MDTLINQKPKSIQIDAIITRADGTVEHIGTVSYWHRNPFKRIIWRIKQWLQL